MAQNNQPIISIDHVSMRFNLAKEKHDVICCFRCGYVYKGLKECPKCGYKQNV